MGQSLENVINKLQKIYQIKASELEIITQEMELKKVAFIIMHLKSVEEISSYDTEKLEFFLLNVDNELNLDDIKMACTVVSMCQNPVIKTGRRYQDAAKVLERVQELATRFVDAKQNLSHQHAECEKSLTSMEGFFNVLTNKVIVTDEDIENSMDILENSLFPGDKHAVLVVIAALVIRNIGLMENPKSFNEVVVENITIPESKLTQDQEDKYHEYVEFVDSLSEKYAEKKSEMVTNTYLKNIESLVERKKISLDEAKEMLSTGSNMYEYFLWNWISKLVLRVDRVTTKKEINELFKQMNQLRTKYDDNFERQKISAMVKKDIQSPRTMIYNVSPKGDNNSFHYKKATKETVNLIKQLKEGKDLEKIPNVTALDNELILITGDSEFVLFKKMPLNHNFVLLSGDISEMDKKLEADFLGKLSTPSTFNALNEMVKDKGIEYRRLMKLTEKVEAYFEMVV
jgi:hypothetical protein